MQVGNRQEAMDDLVLGIVTEAEFRAQRDSSRRVSFVNGF